MGAYLAQLIQQLFLLRRGLGVGRQGLNLCFHQFQVVLLLCCQALDGNLCFDYSSRRQSHRRGSKLVLASGCSEMLGGLRHRSHVLLIGGRKRGRTWLRLRLELKLNLNVGLLGLRLGLLRLALGSGLGGLGYLVMDDKERRMC